jgi:hypothetical protein
MVLGIWIGTCFQQELNKVELVTLPEQHALCKGRLSYGFDSVDVGALSMSCFAG